MKAFVPRTAFALVMAFTFNASATTHYVDLNCTNPVVPYTSWATAATNIQDAINHSTFSDTVLVTNGIYQFGGDSFSGSNRVDTINSVHLQSVNGPLVTMIVGHQVAGTTNGTGAARCVYLREFSTLSGFTLTNGATASGGTGGGVIMDSQCVISNCVVTGNVSGNNGGGIYSANGSLVVNCKIIGNAAFGSSSGGGIYGYMVINSILAGNSCGYRGGAAEGCTLINCTIVGNAGQTDGVDGCKLKNCISYYNTFDNGEGSGDGNSFSNCCVATLPGFGSGNNFTNAPLFADLTNGDYHLMAASPCINAGINSVVTNNNDFDNNPRIVSGTVDVGAYEFQSPVHYVNLSNTAPVSPFTNWLTAATNIQDAIDASVAGDFVVVSNGLYNSGGRAIYGTATNRINLDKALTVQSVNGPSVTTIKGDFTAPTHGGPNARCAYLTNGAVLSGFTLTNGGTAPALGDPVLQVDGGGVWCEDNSATISNCVLTGNTTSQFGGGAFRGTLLNCILTNNFAEHGGGACSNVLINCTLLKNSAAFQNPKAGGGAIYSTLSNCLLVANNTAGGGGGAALSSLTSCVISNNSAGLGGGASLSILNNCLISSNRVFTFGGGSYSNTLNNSILRNNFSANGGGASLSVLNNCTIVSNTASSVGGGVDNGSLNNCLVYHNSSPKIPDYPNDSRSKMNFCDVVSQLATNGFGNITNEPLFVDLANGDFHLQSSSSGINSGNNSYATNATDFDGNPRIVVGTVDIGAYEFQSPSSTISYAYLQQYGLPTDGSADNLDSDGDGMNNYAEWRAGTNPNDTSSLLQMSSAAPTNNFSGAIITWQSVSGVNYFVQRGSDLSASPIFSTIQSNIVGQMGTTSYNDTTATNSIPYFYRVGVQ